MNIEEHIKEMYQDYRHARMVPFAMKLEAMLDFADVVSTHRTAMAKVDPEDVEDITQLLGESVLKWPS